MLVFTWTSCRPSGQFDSGLVNVILPTWLAVHHGAGRGYLRLAGRCGHQAGGWGEDTLVLRLRTCHLISPRTNARVEAMAMVRTIKKIATARHEAEHPPRSLVKFWKLPPRPPSASPALTERRVARLAVSVPDICFNWVELLRQKTEVNQISFWLKPDSHRETLPEFGLS